MVTKLSFLRGCALFASLVLGAACAREILPDENEIQPSKPVEMGTVSFSASFAETVKTTLDGFKPVWVENDKISLFGAAGINSELTLTGNEGGVATFSGTAETEGPFTAIYPYNADNALESGSLVATVPVEQRLDGSVVASGAMLSVAKTTGTDLQFRNVCGLLRLTIASEGVTAVTLQSQDGSALAGTVVINPETGVISEIRKGSDLLTLLPQGETFATGTYSVAVIPGQKKGITVSLSRTADARKGSKSSANTLSLPRNTSISLGSFSTTGLQWGYRIGNYADFKAWVADKPHWDSEGDIVLIVGDIDMEDELITSAITDSYPGEIQGNGHCVSHINVHISGSANVGLFGKGYSKEIHDLTFGSEDGVTYDGTSRIVNEYVTESTSAVWTYTGIVTLAGADIVNVNNFIPITVKACVNRSSRTAGIAGWTTYKISIIGCHNYGPITVENHAMTADTPSLCIGGILGGLNTATAEALVSDCHNHATLQSTNICMQSIGGIVGYCATTHSGITIDGCTNEGDIKQLYTATQNDWFGAGGIVGHSGFKSPAWAIIRNCTNKGYVYSEAVHQHYVGGIVGRSDGGAIESCANEGKVEIDHTANASARFQHIGGILAGAMTLGGDNSVKNCVNSGEIIMKVASSGHNKTPSTSTTFYGVNAGGIVGMANSMSAIEGNTNTGSVLLENSYKGKAAYPSIANAGGILGYDFGAVNRFADNSSSGSVIARNTNSSAPSPEAYAGGNIGHNRAITVSSGAGTGTVNASNAASGGTAFAGSMIGKNDGTILTCTYGGTVNGATADETNIVGSGNAPQGSGGDDPGPQGGTFSVSETAVTFPGTGFTEVPLTVTTGEKAATFTLDADWIKADLIPESLAADSGLIVKLLPLTGNVCDVREGTLTIAEEGGETRTVTLSQDKIAVTTDGFPARWEIEKGVTYTENNAAGKRWLNEGIAETVCADPMATSPGLGYISAGSTVGNKLNYSVAPSGTKNISLGNLGEGDYIQFSVPTVSMPAGTDIDFMVTINTNNNKTPKYWLFEYWDAGEWKAQPRYTATDGGNPQYSLDVYDFDPKNHRTFITTFRLTQTVSNDFIRMRLRAVGNVNCAGNTLTPYPTAYMNFPCLTYHSCVIEAYPGIAAQESTPVKLLQLGNSFTYYNGSAFKLKQICRTEGHATDVRINVMGSQEFEHHLDLLPFSQRLVAEGGYDKAILQDGSYFHAEYGAGDASVLQDVEVKYTPEEILALTKRMTAAVKNTSPGADIVLESTWSYPYKTTGRYAGFGDYANFDTMLWNGTTEIAAEDPNINWISPIGKAFTLARSDDYGYQEDVNYLLYTDNYHPHRYGSYLKACVNYLILFGEPFGTHPADCDIPAADAAKLREIAEEIVINAGRELYHIR